MLLKDAPIQHKLMRAIMLTSGAVLLVTCSFYFVYEFFTFRNTTIRQLSILGQIIANNSTAAMAFDSREDANEILSALKAEPHIVAAILYDKKGNLFSSYPSGANLISSTLSKSYFKEHYDFEDTYLAGYQPVVQGNNHLGTLYLRSDMGAMYERIRLYGILAIVVISISFLVAYLLSKNLQKSISKPILVLAEISKAIANRNDYSVRATKLGNDEIGLLTDAFNQMLEQIHTQNQEIQLFNKNLEQKIKERTYELEMANKELEAFSYSVSHDLRAPLRSIDGYSKILIEDYGSKLDDEGKRTLQVIVKNALKMGQLIDDLLAFSRLGKQNVTKIILDMNAIAQRATEEIVAQNNKASEITIDPLLTTKGDSSMLKQVMTNLISNAVKYSTKKEKPLIKIGSYHENDYDVFYVKDNGAGFDMKYYDKLFGVFQRLHSPSEFEGTGVGLALVHRIITKHGGKVWAEGKVNEGATFYFSLPVY